MKKINFLVFGLALLFLASAASFAQTASNIVKKDLSPAEIDNIIKKMTQNEEDFRYALSNYVFTRKATIQTVGLGGQITGTFRRDSFLTFNEDGQRFERILFAPTSTLSEIRVTPEDIEDLGGINPFALRPSEVSLYNFNFLGKERIDELDLYVFDVAPKIMPNPKKSSQRLFQGRIWVDDRDLMIVKSRGKAVPDSKDNKFPVVETWRENVDGKYWFPAYSSSDDELVFDSGQVVRLKMRVSYADYAQGRTSVKVLGDEEVVQDDQPPSKDQPPPPPKKP